jgi:hypothetical protein
VGTNAGRSSRKVKLKLTDIKRVASGAFDGYTLIATKGCFKGDDEDSGIVEVFLTLMPNDPASKIFDLDERICNFVRAAFKELDQDAVYSSVTFTIDGRDLRRTQWLTESLLDEDPPILFPSLVARRLCPGHQVPIEELYRSVGEHYRRLFGNQDRVLLLDQYALLYRPFRGLPSEAEIQLDGWTEEEQTSDWRNWDARILSSGIPRTVLPQLDFRLEQRANFISLFRDVSAREVLFVSPLHPLLYSEQFAVIPVMKCRYDLGIGSTEGLYFETMDKWMRCRDTQPASFQEFLTANRGIEVLENTTYPLVGVSVVTITPDGKVLLKRRSGRVGMNPGVLHVVPSGMAEWMRGLDHPSVFATFLRELDEELFRGPDAEDSFATLRLRPHLRDLSGNLSYLGYAVDLLNHHLEVVVAFKPDAEWWMKWESHVVPNWEYEGGSLYVPSLDVAVSEASTKPWDFVPVCAAALKLASK